MNYLWAGMMLVGIVYASFHGTLPQEAVSLCITMTGVMSFWVGLMKIAEKTGMIGGLSRKLKPILQFLFPGIPKGHIANEYIATNFIANVFGLGWAATPAGLKAMEALADLEKERGNSGDAASDEMCTFLILNISSLQLISVNLIAYRSQYGSANPAAIVGPGIVATVCSTLAAIIFCKIINRRRKKLS